MNNTTQANILLKPPLTLGAPPAVSAAPQDDSAQSAAEPGKIAFGFLWLFTFVLFARPEDIFPAVGLLHLTLVFGACAGIAYIAAVATGRLRFVGSRELTIVLLLTAWFVLGIPFSTYRTGSLEIVSTWWLKTAFAFFLLTQLLTTTERIRKLIWAVVLSQLVATGASIVLQGAGGDTQVGDRLAGINQTIFGWNFLGIAASVTLPYLAALYITRRSLFRTAAILATITFSMWLLILTASRGGFLGVIFSILFTWWMVLRGSPRGRLVGVVVALCLAVSVAKAPDVFWSRLHTIWGGPDTTVNANSESAIESTKDRQFVLIQSLKYTMEFPIFGIGVGNFPDYNGHLFHRPEAYVGTHNTYTQLSSEAGIPALLLFLGLMLTMYIHSRKVRLRYADQPENAETHLLACSTIVALFSFGIGACFAHIAYGYLFYYLAGISAALWTLYSRSEEASPALTEAAAPPAFTARVAKTTVKQQAVKEADAPNPKPQSVQARLRALVAQRTEPMPETPNKPSSQRTRS